MEAITLVPETADRPPVALIAGAADDNGIARMQEANPSITTTRRRRPPATVRAKAVEATIGSEVATI